ncbi:Ig-like domain-containing protein, partial [Ectothiorhodospira lacustris]|uniref:Ig-like domain-containing protein n=1 Tax=Ectothiorhodospira lacustris TaxID=2899127 RepID=UPI001EE8E330
PTTTGTFNFVVGVTGEGNNATAFQVLTILVNTPDSPQIITSELPSGVVNKQYAGQIDVTGGQAPYSWNLESGSLPTGLTLNASNGTISGAPINAGIYHFIVRIEDQNEGVTYLPMLITVSTPAAPIIGASPTLPTGKEGEFYAATLEGTGGVRPYDWAIQEGGLPLGLTLNPANGNISGTPTTSGIFNFIIRLRDAEGGLDFKATSIAISNEDNAFNGTGPAIIPFQVSSEGQYVFDLRHIGNAGFTVELLDENGNFIDTLYSETGDGFAWEYVTLPRGWYLLRIVEGGNWTVRITPPENGGGGDPSDPVVSSIVLLSNTPQLASAGDQPVTLTAFVRDANNVLMEDVRVTFSADSDTAIQVIRGITDESGTAQAQLRTLQDKSNRTVTATASVGSVTSSTQIRVTGTTITITGPTSSVIVGETVNLTLALRDSAGRAIPNAALTVTSATGNTVLTPNPVTGSNGQATVQIVADQGGNDSITVTGEGATSQFTLDVSTDTLTFLSPDANAEIPIGTNQALTVRWETGSPPTPVAGQVVRFTATRGTFLVSPAEVTTNVNGEAIIEIRSTSSGPSIITATTVGGPEARRELLFVATQAATMTLQAEPAVLSTNLEGQDTEQSEIIAVIRDPDGNLVKNKLVRFNLTDITGGSISPAAAVTDAFGRASTTYTAGTTSSTTDGIEIRAWVDDTPSVEQIVRLTTAQKSLFITLGTGNVIAKPDSVRYAKPYGVLITDVSGAPVANADVTIEIWPVRYYKGYWEKPAPALPWNQVITTIPGCENEDQNRNGILDPGEDFNNNGRLDPGNVVTFSQLNLRTDATGFADFDVVYFQQFARWVDVEMRARAVVTGTESIEIVRFRLPILAEDADEDSPSPPGNPSPFGESATCADDV